MIESGDLRDFQALLARLWGLHFGDDKLDLLRDTLRQGLLEGRHAEPAAYFQALAVQPGGPDGERLIEALTVSETFLFRQWDHFRALVEVALPARLKARSAERRLRILSAGCASGEEPYSLAVVLREHFPHLEGWDLSIVGVDVNQAVLRRARQGLYSSWSMRDAPAPLRERYFTAEGRDFRLRPEIQAMVQFQRRNLAEPNPDLWQGGWDLVFCRNMIMYLEPQAAAALVARMAGSLAPGGFLFLGYAETLRGLSQDFHLCHTHDTFYYQRLDGEPRPLPPAPVPEASTSSWDPDLTWIEAIQRASDRIEGLAARASSPQAGLAAPVPLRPVGLERAMDLLRGERFDEALAALPPAADDDTDAALLRAALLVNLGRLPEAREACARVLAKDELSAGAHYIMALCREQAGDAAGAEEQDRMAVYLDPGFAMPWLHLGLLARRLKRGAEARRHLEQALSLLAREDSSRVLLFGGGFGREGLIQLCRNSLSSLEAAP